MKKKTKWSERSSALRKLLHDLQPSGRVRHATKWCFGAVYRQDEALWYVYNMFSDNTIATVKFVGDKVVIRYRLKSIYAGLLSQYRHPAAQRMIVAPSTRLKTHSDWVKSELKNRVRRRYEAEKVQVRQAGQAQSVSQRVEQELARLRDTSGRYRVGGLWATEQTARTHARHVIQQRVMQELMNRQLEERVMQARGGLRPVPDRAFYAEVGTIHIPFENGNNRVA